MKIILEFLALNTLKSGNRMLDKVRKEDEIITTVQKKNLPVDWLKQCSKKGMQKQGGWNEGRRGEVRETEWRGKGGGLPWKKVMQGGSSLDPGSRQWGLHRPQVCPVKTYWAWTVSWIFYQGIFCKTPNLSIFFYFYIEIYAKIYFNG